MIKVTNSNNKPMTIPCGLFWMTGNIIDNLNLNRINTYIISIVIFFALVIPIVMFAEVNNVLALFIWNFIISLLLGSRLSKFGDTYD
jgi:signal transduction histidine kinase